MIPTLRDPLATPLNPITEPVLSWAYIEIDDDQHSQAITSRLDGWVDGLESARQMLHAIVNTERYSVPFMEPDDGIEIEDLIGKSFGYCKAVIENRLRAAILREDIYTGLKILEITRLSPTAMGVRVRVFSIFGPVEEYFDIPLARRA